MRHACEPDRARPQPQDFERFLTAVVLTRCLDAERPPFAEVLGIEGLIERLARILRSAVGSGRGSRHARSSALPMHKLRLVTAHVDAHLDEPIRVAQLAALARVSPFHFSRQFRAATGLAPHQYVLQCRMQRAARLLCETGAAVGNVAVDVGCADQSHFTRIFQRSFGCTPREFRRSMQDRQVALASDRPGGQ